MLPSSSRVTCKGAGGALQKSSSRTSANSFHCRLPLKVQRDSELFVALGALTQPPSSEVDYGVWSNPVEPKKTLDVNDVDRPFCLGRMQKQRVDLGFAGDPV